MIDKTSSVVHTYFKYSWLRPSHIIRKHWPRLWSWSSAWVSHLRFWSLSAPNCVIAILNSIKLLSALPSLQSKQSMSWCFNTFVYLSTSLAGRNAFLVHRIGRHNLRQNTCYPKDALTLFFIKVQKPSLIFFGFWILQFTTHCNMSEITKFPPIHLPMIWLMFQNLSVCEHIS